LRQLADWYSADGRVPAQLAVWRRLLSAAVKRGDTSAIREARAMVRALQILVAPTDPVTAPPEGNDSRRAMAAVARRGG
jgi:hypothetical protein